jgi:signal transduction histidine kinase
MKRRVTICLGLLLVLCILGDAIAMLCLDSSIAKLGALADSHRIQAMRADLASSGSRLESDLLALIAGLEIGSSGRLDSAQEYEIILKSCALCHHAPELQEKLDELKRSLVEYQEVVGQLKNNEDPLLDNDLQAQAVALVGRLTGRTDTLVDRARQHLAVRSGDVAESLSTAWLVLSITLVMVLVSGGLIALHLERRITQPVRELLDGINQVKQGNLAYRFAVHGDEEFRDLARALNQAYSSLQTAQDSIFQAEKMAAVGKFAAGIAHEVGNPLASISSIAQMMRRQGSLQQQEERASLIMDEVERINGIVRDLLTFSRPTADQQFELVDVAELLDRAVNLLKYDRRCNDITIKRTCDGQLGLVRGNADRLTQVFTNIMINAFDAIGSHNGGRGHLTIATEQRDGKIIIKLIDDGLGMTEQQMQEAFDPFFTTKEPGQGTGLGLWICYQVIHRHCGHIELESELGQGTTVTVGLPCADSRLQRGDADGPTASGASSAMFVDVR